MSVYKPKGSPFFHFDFQKSGRRFHGSTGSASRREAEAVERVEREKAEKEIESGRKIDRTSIEHAWARFWEEKGQHDAKNSTTFDRMEALQDGLSAILKELERPATIGHIGADVIATYVARRRGTISRAGRLLSNASVNRELQVLRRIMRRAHRVWLMDIRLPAWDELMLPEADERVVDVAHSLEEKILALMREDFRPAARFLTMSGLRAGNALPLHPSLVDFEAGVITIHQKSKKPGGRLHILPITAPMRVILANEIGHSDDAVFTYVAKRTRGERLTGERYPLTPETFYNEFKTAAREAGRPDLRPHDLRHVAGTRALRAKGNLRAAQRQLGHSRISTTTKYAHYLVEELRANMEEAHKAPEPADPIQLLGPSGKSGTGRRGE